MTEPAYKDVKVAFKVTEPNSSDRVIINTAEITDDTDEDGNPVEDIEENDTFIEDEEEIIENKGESKVVKVMNVIIVILVIVFIALLGVILYQSFFN